MTDDPTFEGWTTLPPPMPPGYMDMPTGRKLDSPPAKGCVGTMTYGIEAEKESIKLAARH